MTANYAYTLAIRTNRTIQTLIQLATCLLQLLNSDFAIDGVDLVNRQASDFPKANDGVQNRSDHCEIALTTKLLDVIEKLTKGDSVCQVFILDKGQVTMEDLTR